MLRVIVALSGGKASAWCADWALKNYPKKNVILYFNDTKWEHPDLYRFLRDLRRYFNHPIMVDADGRSPEELFYDHHALANNRMPFCSQELKAKRLQKFYRDGDILVFGIGTDELTRANRLVGVYQTVAVKTGKWPKLIFPLIHENITKEQVDKFVSDAGIKVPLLYRLGFLHNNCSGGCVRAGKKHWKLLLEKLPEVYADRERVEEEVRKYFNKDIHFFKDETLKHFRERVQQQQQIDFGPEDDKEVECIGICTTQN
jgi:3'-phosphoadenosine 5'-phosphosulfate sulfotransferase (PAPS reductase)/FAD synthetase